MRLTSVERERGQSLVELALAAPVLLLLILGIVDVTGTYSSYLTLMSASREGARLAARGNIFQPSDVLLVVEQHSPNLDIAGSSSVLLTTATCTTGGCTTSVQTLLGGATSKYTQASLQSLQQSALNGAHNYTTLATENFVVLEVFYTYHPITGFLGVTFPMYACTIMQVSAPS